MTETGEKKKIFKIIFYLCIRVLNR